MQWALLILQSALAAGLAYSCFCRLVLTDSRTVREVRWAITYEAAAAMFLLGAPILPLIYPFLDWEPFTTPTIAWVFLLLGALLIQAATARHWRNGQPPDFLE